VSLNQKKIRVPSLVLPLLLLGVVGHGTIALAQSAGTFTAIGNMTTVRVVHTATLLLSGKVLIAGGTDYNFTIGTAELYDPSTGAFTATGRMTTPRALHTATLLANGKVLISGGGQTLVQGGPGSLLSSAEIYDPATETFSPAGNMSVARQSHTATLLANGKVLIAGGTFWAAPIELYDPSTGTFTTAATTLPLGIAPGGGGAATLLADGTVFFTTLPYGSLGGGVVYSPASDTFSYRGDQGSGLYSHYAVSLLLDGKVLMSGGSDFPPDIGSILAGAQLYDPSSGGFGRTGNMTTCRFYHTSTLLPDGAALIAGGFTTASDGICPSADLTANLASAEVYEPAAGAFTATGDMSTARSFHTATLLNDGSVLIAGGSISVTADIYHPAVLIPAPALFSLLGDGRGQGAIWHASTGQVASADNPAIAGESLSMYTAKLVSGGVIPPQVAVGGQLANVLYFGGAPGYPGYNQVNFALPNDVTPGPAIPVRLTYLGRPSNEVTIGVR
jgi:hypothetical protein